MKCTEGPLSATSTFFESGKGKFVEVASNTVLKRLEIIWKIRKGDLIPGTFISTMVFSVCIIIRMLG